MLLFDHGERRSGVPAELERLGVHVRGARLPAGERHRAGARTELDRLFRATTPTAPTGTSARSRHEGLPRRVAAGRWIADSYFSSGK